MTWDLLDSPVLQGDCIEHMAELPEASVDAIVTDPPYGIGFMGHEWDQPGAHGPVSAGHGGCNVSFGGDPHPAMEAGRYDLSLTANQRYQAWCEAWARECLRILTPGGHMLVCGGSRTHHRLASGIEDAGFEIRDRIESYTGSVILCPDGSLAWYFGSGFPKSLDVSKAIDKAAGAEREVVAESRWGDRDSDRMLGQVNDDGWEPGGSEVTAPATPEAEQWQGWGTALKPGHEPIVVARKPLDGTVAANVLQHGTGGLNIDECRVDFASEADRWKPEHHRQTANGDGYQGINNGFEAEPGAGRWPANVVLSEEAAAELDAQTGELRSGTAVGGLHRRSNKTANTYGEFKGERTEGDVCYGDSGGASRFFYCAKTSRGERNAGLEGFASKPLNWSNGEESPGTFQAEGTEREARNDHPTVKPINLMRWLVRLVTPPGGIVLDPFLGSGSTGCAAALEGFDFVGIEREPEYIAIAEARIAFWSQHVGREVEDVLSLHRVSEREAKAHADRGQVSIDDLLSTEAAA